MHDMFLLTYIIRLSVHPISLSAFLFLFLGLCYTIFFFLLDGILHKNYADIFRVYSTCLRCDMSQNRKQKNKEKTLILVYSGMKIDNRKYGALSWNSKIFYFIQLFMTDSSVEAYNIDISESLNFHIFVNGTNVFKR